MNVEMFIGAEVAVRIVQKYSHQNGLEYLEAREPALWQEIQTAIANIDPNTVRTKVSKEIKMHGRMLFSPKDINKAFCREFDILGWNSKSIGYYVCSDEKINRQIMHLDIKDQKRVIESAGLEPIYSTNQTDFVKGSVAVEVQLGKYSFVAYDMVVKHLAFYVADEINVGVEIIPMKSMQRQMSSGPAHYEGELFNVIRQGRGFPPVPLVLIGIDA